MEMLVLSYAMIASYTVSMLSHNARHQRAHSPALVLTGWSLLGSAATIALVLPLYPAIQLMLANPPN